MIWTVALILAPLTAVLLYQFSYIIQTVQLHRKRAELADTRALSPGSRLRRFTGRDLRSRTVRGIEEWAGAPFVLLALSATCASCRSVASELQSASDEDLSGSTVLALCAGGAGACEAMLSAVQSVPVLLVSEEDVPEIFVAGLPLAVAIDRDGEVNQISHPASLVEVLSMMPSTHERGERLYKQKITTEQESAGRY